MRTHSIARHDQGLGNELNHVVSGARCPVVALDFGQIQVQVLVAPLTEEGFRQHLEQESARIKGLLRTQVGAAPRKAVALSHPSMPMATTPAIRQMQADWVKAHQDVLRLVCHSVGFIIPNPIVRYTVTAVLWLASLPVPMVAHENLDAAVMWAIREADLIGGDVHSELRMDGVKAIERRLAALPS